MGGANQRQNAAHATAAAHHSKAALAAVTKNTTSTERSDFFASG
jgi:hypothetical protein